MCHVSWTFQPKEQVHDKGNSSDAEAHASHVDVQNWLLVPLRSLPRFASSLLKPRSSMQRRSIWPPMLCCHAAVLFFLILSKT